MIPDPGHNALIHRREYPQTWYLLDVVGREPRILGQEVVDLSPGAIELRSVARELRRHAEDQGRWVPYGLQPMRDRVAPAHWRKLSFGPEVGYFVEHDESREIHGGRPIRHLSVRFASRVLSPATSAEIGLYFYGRRPAAFAFTRPDEVHGFIGVEWEPVSSADILKLIRHEVA